MICQVKNRLLLLPKLFLGCDQIILNTEFQYDNGAPSYRPIMRDIYVCTGQNPTAAVPSVTPVASDYCQDITDYVGLDGAVACRACMTLQGNAALVDNLVAGSYIEMEFGGIVSFIGMDDKFSNIENIEGTNVWRFFWAEDQTAVSFSQTLKFTGSNAMSPNINWVQACNPPPTTAPATTTPPATSTVPLDGTSPVTTPQPIITNPALARVSCHPVENYEYTLKEDSGVESGSSYTLTPQLLTTDLIVQEYSYLELTYTENWQSLAEFSIPGVQVLVQVSSSDSFVADSFFGADNNVIVELGNEVIGAESFDLNLDFAYHYSVKNTREGSNTLQSVSICHRTSNIELIGPLTDEEYCSPAQSNLEVHQGPR